VSCDGTVVIRTEAGKLEVSHIAKNNPQCLGPKVPETEAVSVVTPVDSVTTQTGAIAVEATGSVTTQVTSPEVLVSTGIEVVTPRYDATVSGPLLDLASTDIVNYRLETMREKQIRYAEVIRSVRMRQMKSKNSKTVAYLMNNEPLVVSGTGLGWIGVQGATVSVTDTRENTIEADTTGKASGYIASRYLRNPNSDDLVRLGQADQAYWSDVAHVNVAYLVNVRSHPWYGASIVAVLGNQTPLYIVSTVDNWSEVKNDDDSIHGYIRSDYLVTDKKQRQE